MKPETALLPGRVFKTTPEFCFLTLQRAVCREIHRASQAQPAASVMLQPETHLLGVDAAVNLISTPVVPFLLEYAPVIITLTLEDAHA
jgi:hypothetical protein